MPAVVHRAAQACCASPASPPEPLSHVVSVGSFHCAVAAARAAWANNGICGEIVLVERLLEALDRWGAFC